MGRQETPSQTHEASDAEVNVLGIWGSKLVAVTLPLETWTLAASAMEVFSEDVTSKRSALVAAAAEIDAQVRASFANHQNRSQDA